MKKTIEIILPHSFEVDSIEVVGDPRDGGKIVITPHDRGQTHRAGYVIAAQGAARHAFELKRVGDRISVTPLASKPARKKGDEAGEVTP